jgi:hypothetical protein
MGIYLIHVLLLIGLNSNVIPGLPLYNNTGSMAAMTVSAVVYFVLSAVICLCGKRVRGIGKCF